jgi:formamidopyrimidine-DNA glycosylase
MPELPEVETVCRGLAKALPGRVIARVQQNRADLRVPFPAALNKITRRRVTNIGRRAKYILIHLDSGQTLVLHLGMSGSLVLQGGNKKYHPEKHDHMLLTLDNGATVVLNDPRRFGLVELAATKDLDRHRFFAHLGPEPLEKKFTAAYLAEKMKTKKVAIKLAIMDQRVVVGVGNIYAAEALFDAGIDPRRAAGTLKPAEIKKLVAAIRQVLKRAIRAGGSSLRDYVQADGELGYFQHQFSVYDKIGQKCKGCACNIKKTGGVQRLIQGGRSTFYCPVKQA